MAVVVISSKASIGGAVMLTRMFVLKLKHLADPECLAKPVQNAATVTSAILALTAHMTCAAAQSPASKVPGQLSTTELSSEDLLRNIACLEQRLRALEQKNDPEAPSQMKSGSGSSEVAKSPGGSNSSATSIERKPDGATDTQPTVEAMSQVRCATTSEKPWITTTNKDLFVLKTEPSPETGNKDLFGLVPSPVDGLKIGAYGEVKYGAMQNAAANGQWQNGFDAHRLVLLPTYEITKNIIFNAEIEFEHGGAAFDPDDKLHGTAEVEQLFIDFKIVNYFNFRAPGIDLVPIGYTNQHHEPTQFYSVQRPEIANSLVPTTFKAPATSIYGVITDGLSYQFQVSSSIEDFGDDFSKRTDANAVAPFPQGYAPGIDGKTALTNSRPVLGDFRQLSSQVAYALQLTYAPAFFPGFAGSTSGYFTPNTTPRGAYSDTGAPLGSSSLALFDTEFRYRVPDSGLELRSEFAFIAFGDPANLRANNDSDPTNNVGKSMWGWSGEVAYHVPLGTILNSEWEAVPFYRYTREALQMKGFAGTDANLPSGAGELQFHTAGVAVFPSPKVALKLNYQKVIDNEPGGARSDSVLGGVGFFF
jgi:hypothetical protein